MSELDDIIAFYEKLEHGLGRCALATVIETVGPSYRSPGAQSLITDSGEFHGGLSAGCLEGDVGCRLDGGASFSGKPFIIEYDLASADEIRGFPFGCGGTVKVFVEPSFDIEALRWLARQTQACVMFTVIENSDDTTSKGHGGEFLPGSRFALSAAARFNWTSLNESDQDRLARLSGEVMAEKKSRMVSIAAGDSTVSLFAHYFEPAISVTIFGDGQDARALQAMAESAGMRARLVTRSAIRRGEFRFNDSFNAGANASSSASSDHSLSRFCVVMTHDLDLDGQLVDYLLSRELKYLGILGPKSRTERLLKAIGKESEVLSLPQVFAPVGLSLGAETPAEIALSIVAEIQAVARQCKPDHLRHSDSAIHDRAQTGVDSTVFKYAGVILAAGSASRFGGAKQAAKYNGVSLIELAQNNLLACELADRAVIVGGHSEQIRPLIHQSLCIVENKKYKEGLSGSIGEGVKFAREQGASHLLVTLCDQPLVTSALLNEMLRTSILHPDSVVACRYLQSAGVPAIFPARCFEKLLNLTGDRGAKAILETEKTVMIDFEAASVDIDRPQDLDQICTAADVKR